MDVLLSAPALLAAAWFWDRLLAEPPARLHPVVWMGTLTTLLLRAAPSRGRLLPLVFGAALVAVVGGISVALYRLLHVSLSPWPWAQWLLACWALKSSFALRALGQAGQGVAGPLRDGDLPAAREGLRSLCSRDPSDLDEQQVCAGAVESLAENLSDSVVAPLFYFALLGVPGALAFRAVNTLDAMVGYRGRYEWLGKVPARLDDLLGLVPARLTAVLLAVAAAGSAGLRGLRVAFRDAAATASPNAGWPMATVAGVLGVQLAKPGHYQLGDAGEVLGPDTIDRCWSVVQRAGVLAALIAGACVAVWSP